MTKITIKLITIGQIVGAIIIGAIGSGVWDLFLKRVILYFWEIIANTASMGISSIRNIPYQNAAQGSPYDTIFYLALLAIPFFLGRKMSELNPTSIWKIPADLTKESIAEVNRRQQRLSIFMTWTLSFFLMFQVMQMRITYQVVDDFNHNIAALAPLVPPQEAAKLRYWFTHMKSREDYKTLMDGMAGRAEIFDIKLPR